MTKDLQQAINKIIVLSKTSTLCANYSNNNISVSFAITNELTFTEQATGDSFSLWFTNDGMATPTEINLKYSDIKNVECSVTSIKIELVNGTLIVFEDVI